MGRIPTMRDDPTTPHHNTGLSESDCVLAGSHCVSAAIHGRSCVSRPRPAVAIRGVPRRLRADWPPGLCHPWRRPAASCGGFGPRALRVCRPRACGVRWGRGCVRPSSSTRRVALAALPSVRRARPWRLHPGPPARIVRAVPGGRAAKSHPWQDLARIVRAKKRPPPFPSAILQQVFRG